MVGVEKKFGLYEIVSVCMLIIMVLAERVGVFGNCNMGTIIMLNVLQGFVIAFAIALSGYLKFRLGDYIMMASIMFVIEAIFVGRITYMAILIGSLWVLINVFVYIRYHNLKARSIECFLTFVVGIAGYFLFDNLYYKGFNQLYEQLRSNYQTEKSVKAVVLIGITSVILLIIWIILLGIKLVLNKYISQLGEISSKYEEISKYLLLIPWFVITVLWICKIFEESMYFEEINLIKYNTGLIVALVVVMQLLYIRMLVKTIRLKEHLANEEMEKDSLREYSSNLAENMQEIRAIKHDIKNVFLTMGEFVAKSNDEEFKEYYQEKIVPFASQELKMNDLYVALKNISNESLRAFFYYKMMQGIERGIDIELSASMTTNILNKSNSFTDITRILGIFIDNAIEEAIQTPEKKIEINLKEDEEQLSFIVKNSVRKDIQQRGVVIGTTTKGLGRGQGLTIAKKIIEKYDNILWNSYFTDDKFVQAILIQMEK